MSLGGGGGDKIFIHSNFSCTHVQYPVTVGEIGKIGDFNMNNDTNFGSHLREIDRLKLPPHLDEQFLQFSALGFVSLGTFHCA